MAATPTLADQQPETRAARRLLASLRAVRKIDPEMPAQTLSAIMVIFSHWPEPITMNTLQQELGLTDATTSRIVSRLSEWEKYDTKPGKDFVKRYPNPNDRRYQFVQLTPKGITAARSILNHLVETPRK